MAAADENEKVTLYLRNVPAALVREAKVKAVREGATLTEVVIGALARATHGRAEAQPMSEEELRESMEWYAANRTDLLERYPGQYVAIVDNEVVDHDEAFEALATRVFARIGVKPIFMPRVVEGDEQIRVRSPRRRAS